MSRFLLLRALAWVKRSTLALEHIAESQAILAGIAKADAEARANASVKTPRKLVEIHTPTIDERNEMLMDEPGMYL